MEKRFYVFLFGHFLRFLTFFIFQTFFRKTLQSLERQAD